MYHFIIMERIEKKWSKASWLRKLWTCIALVWALLTQNPQEANAQHNNKIPVTEEVLNDSTIHWDFNPELIESLWTWKGKSFVINPDFLKKDENWNEYISINWNRYYNIYFPGFDDHSWFWYTWLWNYCSTPNSFFIWVVKNNRIWNHWILIQPNWDCYQWWFEDELYEGSGSMDFWDWRHYEWEFHEWKMEWKWELTWKNWDYYKWDFANGKRNWEGYMSWKWWTKYEWTWVNDLSVKDPRRDKNPVITGKWTYTYYWDDKVTYEVSNGNRPNFISVQDKKGKENWDNRRWTIVYIVKNDGWKKSYELHSWNRDISYKEVDNYFVFSAQDGAELKFQTSIWEKKAEAIANLINSVMSMVKNNDKWYSFYAFDYQGDILQAQYRNAIFDTNLVKDIPWKIGISAKEFSEWLNHYRNDKPDWQFSY